MNIPPYKRFPTLSGKRILLRQIEISDIRAIIEISFYDSKQAKTYEEAFQMQERINQDYENGNSIHWGISDLVRNQIVGTCGYYRGFKEGTGELGFVLLPAFQGQGYMSEAILLAMNFGFTSLGLKRIIAITSAGNFKTIKLLENLKFTRVSGLNADEIEFEFLQK
jgi:[ribosomal protein S5]-alanine N-acetyltransferase